MLSNGTEQIVLEGVRTGRPRAGQVFAAVHAHVDDVPYFAAGLCSKLIEEGATGYLIRTSNDEKCGPGTAAENILSAEGEHARVAKALGFKDVFELYYQNHEMDAISTLDIRGRLIFLFRMLSVDIVLSFNPSAWEEDPDHRATARAAEEAATMCGTPNDFHEHMEAGIRPHPVVEHYYFHTRPGQPFNRVVDIGCHIGKKIDAVVECKSQGGGDFGARLRARLAKEGKRLALLEGDERTANRRYAEEFLLAEYREYGKPYQLPWAERFYYVDRRPALNARVEEYVARHAEPL